MKTENLHRKLPHFFRTLLTLILFTFLTQGAYAQGSHVIHPVDVTTADMVTDKCKETTWYVEFTVPASPNGGWIVQHIHLVYKSMECPPDCKVLLDIDEHYYEAWPVPANGTTSTTTGVAPNGKTWNDRYFVPTPDKTKGEAVIKGKVAYIENPAPGTSALPATFVPGSVVYAGGLHAYVEDPDDDTDDPDFWDDVLASGDAKCHDMSVGWNCCCGADTFYKWDTLLKDYTKKDIVDENKDETNDDGDKKQESKSGNNNSGDLDEFLKEYGYTDFMMYTITNNGKSSKTTGIENEVIETSGAGQVFKVYPVPMTESLVIESIGSPDENIHVWLTDINGRLIKDGAVRIEDKVVLDVSALSQGAYFIEITNDQGAVLHKQRLVK